ncbi:MAG TPA: BlaI/MecI/CopY family transcriptional regulator [Polyangiaceae bacterium]
MTIWRGNDVGDLERAILDTLWANSEPLSVRDALRQIRRRPPLAYTTVLTVLDRLHEKGLVHRHKQGRAFLYRPALTKAEWLGQRAARVLASENREGPAVLAAFLDSAERADPKIVNELAQLIAARRRDAGQ